MGRDVYGVPAPEVFMHILNRIFLVNSLLVVLVSVERFSATTRVILQPHSFLSLHQLVQTCVLILAGTVTSWWTFYVVSGQRRGVLWLSVSLLVAERLHPTTTFARRDVALLSVNAIIFAATVVAYAAFDTVLVGLIFALVTLVFSVAMWLPVRRETLRHPVTLYTVITYALGSAVAVALRLM
jgi:hypothetical protein